MVIASIGVVINLITAAMFHGGREHDVNIRGAYLHMAADAAVSLGVVLGGAVILWTGQLWIDPAMSILIAVVIFWGTWGLLRESVNLAMHGVPDDIDITAVREYLSVQTGVAEVHDLHVWAMSTTESALTVHLVIPADGNRDQFLATIAHELNERFGIGHTTIQIEQGSSATECPLAPDHVV